MAKKMLIAPIRVEDLESIHIGDIIYLSGHITACRDVAHRRLIEGGKKLPMDLEGRTILHAGPVIRPLEDRRYEMVSAGPTTSMRVEKLEREFIQETNVHLVVGEGGMDMGTEGGYKEYKALHCVFPAGCTIVATDSVGEIGQAQWLDLGMPEILWTCRVKEFGPLIISIDTYGRSLSEQNKMKFNEKKGRVCERVCREVHSIK